MTDHERSSNQQSGINPDHLPPLEPTAEVPAVHSDKLNDPQYWNNKMEEESAAGSARRHNKKPGIGKKVIAGIAGAAVLGGGAFAGVKMLGGESTGENTTKKETPALILGPDGEPVQYVKFDSSSSDDRYTDRNNDGTPDNLIDTNENGVIDSDELWDQINKEYVDAEADKMDAALANATESELSDIAEIESVLPGSWPQRPHWKAEYTLLDPLVQQRIMLTLHSPDDFANENDWHTAIMNGFSRTAEDIRKNAEAN